MSVAALLAAGFLSLLKLKPQSGASVPAATGDSPVGASL
jgi:hypothetical protein